MRTASGVALRALCLLAACEPASWLPLRANADYCDDRIPCAAGLACNLSTHACETMVPDLAMRECESSPACPMDRPLCEAGRCRACVTTSDDDLCRARDPMRPRCIGNGTCAACRDDADCSGNTPVCGVDSACRGCARNDECQSGVCRDDGACVPESAISYVDNGGKNTADCLGSGLHDGQSKATAFCDVQAAIDAKVPRGVIKIVGGRYDAFKITRSDLRIVGPGTGGRFGPNEYTVSTTAANVPAISTPVDARIAVVVEDLRVGSQSSAQAINCSSLVSGSRMSLRRVHVISPQSTAVLASLQCRLEVSDSRVTDSRVGVEIAGALAFVSRTTLEANQLGISIGDALFGQSFPADATIDAVQLRGNETALECKDSSACRIANSVIVGNGRLDRGLGGPVFDTSGVALLDLSTVVGNLTAAGANGAGVTCRQPALVQSSIFYGNQALGKSQVGAGCVVVSTVTGVGDKNGTALDPAFVAYGNYADLHLKPGDPQNRACCVDKAQPEPGATYNDHDADGRKRPLGAGHDIGAFEAE